MTAPDFTPAELDTLRRFDQTPLAPESADPWGTRPLSPTTCDECLGDGVVDAGRFSPRHTKECEWCEGSGEVTEKDCAS